MKQWVTGLGNGEGGGPARGGKLIIYNRGTERGGDQRVKESEWKMQRRGGGRQGKEPEWAMGRIGRGGIQPVHYAPGSN